MASQDQHHLGSVVTVSFRGEKIDIPLHRDDESPITVGDIRSQVVVASQRTSSATAAATATTASLQITDIKLIFKGKVLLDDQTDVNELFYSDGKSKKASYRIMATGVSQLESQGMDEELEQGMKKTKALVRDDLSEDGQRKLVERQRMGRRLLQESDKAFHRQTNATFYGFDKIETLPNLPDEDMAREILKTLANDPGVRSCMAKHKWRVGSLAELYPEGAVGETEVCVMGLNKNKGQQILLRIRTDDLKGFRKILSIREVLYHELAHNVHSEHDGDFFQLMRQIKKECLEMDWTQGQGTSSPDYNEPTTSPTKVERGHRLGGKMQYKEECVSSRDLARRAALQRLTAFQGRHEKSREHTHENCSCGLQHYRQIDHRSRRKDEGGNYDAEKTEESEMSP